jgi:hypothetical protein
MLDWIRKEFEEEFEGDKKVKKVNVLDQASFSYFLTLSCLYADDCSRNHSFFNVGKKIFSQKINVTYVNGKVINIGGFDVDGGRIKINSFVFYYNGKSPIYYEDFLLSEEVLQELTNESRRIAKKLPGEVQREIFGRK